MYMSTGSTAIIDRPVFIVGPHRSGTTLFYNMLSGHADIGCMVRFNHRFPATPDLAFVLRPLLGGSTKPHEAQRFWDYLWQGPDDTMTADELRPEQKKFYIATIARVLSLRGRNRFLAKYPRLSLRIAWLDALFPDAKFLHITRDWRAVVSSTVQRKRNRENRGGGWFGVRIPGWQQMMNLPHELSAARQFRVTTLAIEDQGQRFAGRFHRVDYARLCADTEGVMRGVADFCELPFSRSFRDSLPRDLKSRNNKWRKHLTTEMVEMIRAEDPDFYARYEDAV